MIQKMTIPYAMADFNRLRIEGNYYVDKTMYIPSLEKYTSPVYLRPRRFGKSLLCSTLYYYYDRTQASRFQELFGSTWIGRNPTGKQGQMIVIRFDFSALAVCDDMMELERRFNILNAGSIDVAAYHNRDIFKNFAFSDGKNASIMLEDLLKHIKQNNLPKAYIIIDEYDNFTNQLLTECKDNLYEDVTTGDSFMRTFFKVIKKGIGEGTVDTCFCTGVLPVTMDDLTSGYNIAQIITLRPEFYAMLGFTHDEAKDYLNYVLDTYVGSREQFDELWNLILSNYDGYQFLPGREKLFNSTILTYFFQMFVDEGNKIPRELIDENLRTDIKWFRRLAMTQENMENIFDSLLNDTGLSYNEDDLSSKFNKRKFFDSTFYPVSLYYLGMTTLKTNYRMILPNLTVRSIFMDYYNEIHKISGKADLYIPAYEQFMEDGRLESLVKNYFEQYLGQLPAQVFDKMNENFVRCSFFELISRYLSFQYTFSIEHNLPSGRLDFWMIGKSDTIRRNDDRIIEFKYFKASEAAKVEAFTEADEESVQQVKAYAKDVKAMFPKHIVRTYVCYICANKVWKCWEV